ncbi:MAG: YezD family protein [Acidaminococcaceae bacterium]|nr:YezD family protein [Acidaminococcaceae bacterium]
MIEQLQELIKTVKFGSISLIIQDGKVVQIDKNEKIRFR